MNTKLSQIEKSLKLKYRLENVGDHTAGNGGGGAPTRAPAAGGSGAAGVGVSGGDGGGGFGHPRNRENEELAQELHRYNGVLLRENSDLKTKIKVRCYVLLLHQYYFFCSSAVDHPMYLADWMRPPTPELEGLVREVFLRAEHSARQQPMEFGVR